jgi:septal ring factor EnvC (AmiA/AmiB activator)
MRKNWEAQYLESQEKLRRSFDEVNDLELHVAKLEEKIKERDAQVNAYKMDLGSEQQAITYLIRENNWFKNLIEALVLTPEALKLLLAERQEISGVVNGGNF